MNSARALRGAGPRASPTLVVPHTVSLRDEVRDLATHIQHAARLALLTVDGEEPEHGAEYLLDTLADLAPRLARLKAARQRYGR